MERFGIRQALRGTVAKGSPEAGGRSGVVVIYHTAHDQEENVGTSGLTYIGKNIGAKGREEEAWSSTTM